MTLRLSSYDYDLPDDLIAQYPPPERTDARMLVVHRDTGVLEHSGVEHLASYLAAGDLLVFNDTRVIPARVYGVRAGTGGQVEVLFLEELPDGSWTALFRASRPARPGAELELAGGAVRARIEENMDGGMVRVSVNHEGSLIDVLDGVGAIPLPPYIRRAVEPLDRERYQTTYSGESGAVAAPTAGLHFTPELLGEIEAAGIGLAQVTLHVGWGTFRPVAEDDVRCHVMESERYRIPRATYRAVEKTLHGNRRVVAVGTTTVRALESAAAEVAPELSDGWRRTTLFIRPPYRFAVTRALLTNFHLPKSTLLMMVSAFAGADLIRAAYREAVQKRYRFYSYGDCMLIV